MAKIANFYPVGIQTFSKIREANYLYVDKTKYIVDFREKKMKYIFLSRPRRFGKSLFASTLQAYFEGRKELFEGLAIADYEKEWIKHPVLHFDLSGAKHMSVEQLERYLADMLEEQETRWGYKTHQVDANLRLKDLVKKAYEQTSEKVVVIIDEYDAPLLDVVHEKENLQLLRRIMQNFYSPLKKLDPYLEFTFITGITKFSQFSIFSELNNLDNISLYDQYSAICGISKTELTTQIKPDVEALGEALGMTYEECLAELTRFYDGYHFSKQMTDIYNPFSILNVFYNKDIRDFWFATGTPTYLIRLMNHFNEGIDELTGREYSLDEFVNYKADTEYPLPMIYQSGYLTIKNYDREMDMFLLDFPNNEVKRGFLAMVASNYLQSGQPMDSWIKRAVLSLRRGQIDQFRQMLTAFLASIPYSMRRKDEERERERYFQYTFYLLLRLMSVYTVYIEKEQSEGRVDCVIETPQFVYIFEFKLDGTAAGALQQIEDKGYAREYEADARPVHKIGVNFSSETGTIEGWEASLHKK